MNTPKLIIQMAATAMLLASQGVYAQTDPLPSWNESPTKQSIISFVERITDTGNSDYVPPAERIATFDNDGTLWSEQPSYVQVQFAVDRIHDLAAEHPEWKTQEPFASVLEGDLHGAFSHDKHALINLLMASHGDTSIEEFRQIVRDWLQSAHHPETGQPYTRMVYQPMLELLDYLRDNQFQTYIVSGGGIEFVRTFSEAVYGIPPQQVIGSSLKSEYQFVDDNPIIQRMPDMNFNNDKAAKPVAIAQHIGRRPVMAFGNSDGDFQMLEWTMAGPGARFAMLVHHTDAERETAYDRDSHIGRLVRGLDEGPSRNWTIVDMKADWKTVFEYQGTDSE